MEIVVTSWLVNHWFDMFVPLLAFSAIAVIGLWARWFVHKILKKQKQSWVGKTFVIETMWHPFFQWFLLLGAFVAIEVSIVSPNIKRVVGEGLASLFALSLIWSTISLSERFIRFYLGKNKAVQSLTSVVTNTVRIIIIITGILVILQIWGAPTLPIVIILSACVLIIGLAFRTAFDNVLAGFEIVYGEHIKLGHLIKLGSGETGLVKQISWTRTKIQTSEGNLVIIPNYKLMATTIVNFGAPDVINKANDVQKVLYTSEPTGAVEILSEREREVLSLIGIGATNREIAFKLIISEHTVKSHLRSILIKLNMSNRQQAAVYAERLGLIVEAGGPKTGS